MYGKIGHMAIKLEMSKAYNGVEWNFLEAIMGLLGFVRRWINLNDVCQVGHICSYCERIPNGADYPF